MKWSVKSWYYSCYYSTDKELEDGNILTTMMFHYQPQYYTTLEQEEKLNTAIQSWVHQNIEDKDSEFEKVFKIYSFITNNVDYDYTYKKISAYEAFFDGSSVCQGYSMLFYRMCKTAELDNVLMITGSVADSWESHAWNIVKIGDIYYCLDPTWDGQGKGVTEQFGDFLRGTDFFDQKHVRGKEYTTEEFNRLYPISKNDFSFITNKITENQDMGILTGFDISKGVIKKENLLNNGYVRNDINIDIDVISEQSVIGTNTRIEIKKDGILLDRFVAVIYGDINGDGQIKAVDALTLIKGINGKIYFENPYMLEAGRILTNGDNKPKAADALAIIKHINGKYTINQSR